MDEAIRRENEQFENDVRRIARALWPGTEFSGADYIDGRESDGVFITEDCIHVIEATTSRKKQKAEQDINKLKRSLHTLNASNRYRALRGWFITLHEPTVDQRKFADPQLDSINIISFAQFQAQLIDSRQYLHARDNYRFGSVRDIATGGPKPNVDYIPLDLVKLGTLEAITRADISSLLDEGRTVALLGEYGAGKSMTLREAYRAMRKHHLQGKTPKFPVYLNLRDHYGQTDPAEVIERHGRSIGFDWPTRLVKAWRAGYVHLLIDGFDEISAISIQGVWRRLKYNRYRATEVIRRLIGEQPSGAGTLVAGRTQFFDSDYERRDALGLSHDSIEISLSEFTDSQIKKYLELAGFRGFVPTWLPSRPLLVGYLAARSLLYDSGDEEPGLQMMNRAEGWHTLIDRVASREAEIEAGIDGYTVRRILERLATKARISQDGLGPLDSESVIRTFREICGDVPDDRGMVLLQRLPGLGVDSKDEESRRFIDADFADTCRAGDLVEFVEGPYGFDKSVLADMASSIGSLGIEVAAYRCKRDIGVDTGNPYRLLEGKINAALSAAIRLGANYFAGDLSRLIVKSGFNVRESVRLSGLHIPELELEANTADLSKLEFRDCFFGRVTIDRKIQFSNFPFFHECYIHEIDGPLSRDDLPKDRFDGQCVIELYVAKANTTNTILQLDLPLGVKVCLTILKKLYEQRGSGRKENALHRGLDGNARRLVADVLRVLQTEGLATPDRSRGDIIWHPDRSSRSRVGRLISAPAGKDDPVLKKCANLSG